jgi:acetyl esterase/lipase
MDINNIHPQLRAATKSFPKLPVASGFGRFVTRLLLPLLVPRAKDLDGLAIENVTTAAGLKLRIYTPAGAKKRAALLYFHGGGMMIGTPSQDDRFLASTAAELDVVIVSPDYRLAPENPAPAALDDCRAAWAWMIDNQSTRGIDTARMAIGGESAGGGLAAGLVLRIHDEGGIQPVAQWLFCPMLDDRTALDRSLDEVSHFVWNNTMNRVGWHSYLGKGFGTDEVSGNAAPARRVNLRGLPKAWIGVGDVELFFDECAAYAERLSAYGVPCDFEVVSGAPHSFQTLAPDSQLAKDYLANATRWLGRALKV